MPDPVSQEMGVAAVIAELMYLRQSGHLLTPNDIALLDSLESLDRCEQNVRAAVAAGQLTAASSADGTSENLPESLADTIRLWMDAQSAWELAVTGLSSRQKQTSKRSGPRGQMSPAATIRVPTTAAATKAMIAIINTKLWTEREADEQLVTKSPQDSLRVNLSSSIGFDATTAIEHLTRQVQRTVSASH